MQEWVNFTPNINSFTITNRLLLILIFSSGCYFALSIDWFLQEAPMSHLPIDLLSNRSGCGHSTTPRKVARLPRCWKSTEICWGRGNQEKWVEINRYRFRFDVNSIWISAEPPVVREVDSDEDIMGAIRHHIDLFHTVGNLAAANHWRDDFPTVSDWLSIGSRFYRFSAKGLPTVPNC